MQKTKIAVLGGTFNPIHFGHLVIAQSVYLSEQFDEVWMMPAGHPPVKPEEKTSVDHRVAMVNLAIRKTLYLRVSDLESESGEMSYTYKTLDKLHQSFPDCEFWWIIGYDNVFELEIWEQPVKLLTNGRFVVVRRKIDDDKDVFEKMKSLQDRYGCEFILVDNPMIEISSQMIRERRQNHEPIDFLTPRKVVKYIEENGLYLKEEKPHQEFDYPKLTEEIRKDLKKVLSLQRYRHTLGVESTAVLLGMHYEISPERLSVAALLHDFAKCMAADKKRKLADKFKIPVNPREAENPDLLHAKLGAYLAREKYQIEDEELLDAIYYHTTGKPAMSDFAKIIYIADAIEPGRGTPDYLEQARKYSMVSLDKTMLYLLEETLGYLNKKKRDIDPLSVQAYHYYKNIEEKGNL